MNDTPRRHSLWPLALATTVAVMGGFLQGYDNLVIAGTLDYLAQCFSLSGWGQGVAASSAQMGALAGALGSGWMADRIGLKKSLYLCAAAFVASSIGIYLSHGLADYVSWRLLCGLSSGAASTIAPMYVAEIAPARVRGRLVTFYQLGMVFGIFCAVLVNAVIQGMGDEAWNVAHGWRWMFLMGLAPGVVFFLSVLGTVESPRWLMKVGREAAGLDILRKLNGAETAGRIAGEIREALGQEKGRMSELFRGPFRKPLIIGVALAAFSQLSGVIVVLAFLPEIFKASGAAAADAFFQAVLVGLVNIVFSLVALWLIDKAGRRSLILVGTTIQFAALTAVGVMFAAGVQGMAMAVGIMAFMAGHGVGNGAACWVIISEIFPTKLRGRAVSLAITSMCISSYLCLLLFPSMRGWLGNAGTFWFFAAAAVGNFLFVWRYTPETRGYTLEEIEAMWRAGAPPAQPAEPIGAGRSGR